MKIILYHAELFTGKNNQQDDWIVCIPILLQKFGPSWGLINMLPTQVLEHVKP